MHDTHPLFYLWVSILSHVVVAVSALLASLSVHMPVFPFVCLFVCLSACLPICLCVILSVSLSACRAERLVVHGHHDLLMRYVVSIFYFYSFYLHLLFIGVICRLILPVIVGAVYDELCRIVSRCLLCFCFFVSFCILYGVTSCVRALVCVLMTLLSILLFDLRINCHHAERFTSENVPRVGRRCGRILYRQCN